MSAALAGRGFLSAAQHGGIVARRWRCANFRGISEDFFHEFTQRSKYADAFQKKNNAGNSY